MLPLPLNHALVSAHTSEQHACPELNLPRRQARRRDPAELRVAERTAAAEAARNEAEAKKFYDFALKADIQTMAAKANSFQVPSNKAAAPPPEAPKLADIKLIDYDFKKYGSSAERKRLLEKWEKEVNALPR